MASKAKGPGKAAPPPTTSRATVERKRTGDLRRRLTVYIPPDLFRALGHWAVDADMDLSSATVEAIRRMVERKTTS